MADYSVVLARAIAALSPNTPQTRRAVYDRAREALTNELRGGESPVPEAEVSAQLLALELAIKSVETQAALAELAHAEGPAERVPRRYPAEEPADDWGYEDQPSRFADAGNRRNLIIIAAGIAGIAVIGVLLWALLGGDSKNPQQPGRGTAAAPSAARPGSAATPVKLDSQLPYFFRRQPVYFRTNYPVGSVVIQKSQRFLYLIRPNVVAWRYGIAISDKCVDTNGVLRVAAKEDTPNNGKKPAKAASDDRVLLLDQDARRIAGTDAPKTIGQVVPRGCVYLVDDDFIDLYDRVPLGTSVVFAN